MRIYYSFQYLYHYTLVSHYSWPCILVIVGDDHIHNFMILVFIWGINFNQDQRFRKVKSIRSMDVYTYYNDKACNIVIFAILKYIIWELGLGKTLFLDFLDSFKR